MSLAGVDAGLKTLVPEGSPSVTPAAAARTRARAAGRPVGETEQRRLSVAAVNCAADDGFPEYISRETATVNDGARRVDPSIADMPGIVPEPNHRFRGAVLVPQFTEARRAEQEVPSPSGLETEPPGPEHPEEMPARE